MPFVFLLAITGLTLSAVAIYYSVIGLTAIFAAAFWPIVIMGTTLEVSKLVAASWLKAKWSVIPRFMKTYMTTAVFILMFITSMGIFGFLSKAHIEQTSMSTEQVAQIDTLNDKIARSEAKINRWSGDLGRLNRGEDVRVDNLIANEQEGLDKIYARIKDEKSTLQSAADKKIALQQERIAQAQDRRDKAIAAAEEKFKSSFGGSSQYEEAVKKAKDQELGVASAAQREILKVNTQLDKDLDAVDAKYKTEITAIQKRIQGLRDQANDKTQDIEGKITELENSIEAEQKKIDDAREEKFVYEKEYRKLEAEVGPIKYIAEFIYGDTADQTLLEKAVTWVIITIIFVFDPLAVLMLLASQMTYAWYKENGNDQNNDNGSDAGGEDPTPSEEGIETDSEPQDEESVEEPPEVDPVVAPAEQPKIIPTGFEEIKEPSNEENNTSVEKEEESVQETLVEEPKKKAEEIVDDDDDDDEFENVSPSEKAAMHRWKAEHPDNSLKLQKKLLRMNRIDELPWKKYMEEEKQIVSWMEHDENGNQIRKEGYIQNEEQIEGTI